MRSTRWTFAHCINRPPSRWLFFWQKKIVYLKWIAFLPASLLFDVVGRLLAPVVVLFADDDGWPAEVAMVVSDA